MRDRDERVVAALQAEAESVPLTLTEAAVHERLARPPATPWARHPGLAVAGAAVATVVLAIVMAPQPRSGADQAEPIQLEPGIALPSPYDWDGVRDALAPRGLQLEIPSAAERAEKRLTARQALEIVREEYAAEVGVTIVSLHLAEVTNANERLPLRNELMYVAESTGHETGNCFTLVGAADGEPVIGACFYPERKQPYASLPVGIYLADRPIGTTCLGLTLPPAEDGLLLSHAVDLRAQWWNVGAAGDCATTSSSVVSTSVELVAATTLAVAIPTMDGGERRIVVEIVQPHDGGFGAVVTSGDQRAEVAFSVVELIDPHASPQVTPSSPEPESGAASASPSAEPGSSVRDTIWRVVVSDLVVRSEPGVGDASSILPASLTDEDRVLVVDGPRDVDGYTWYQVLPIRPDGLRERPFGWVASASREGEPWLVREELACPGSADLEGILRLAPEERLACYGGRTIRFRGGQGGCGAAGGLPVSYEPRWLRSESGCGFGSEPGQISLVLRFPPGVPNDFGDAAKVEVVGHFDDPAAATCVGTANYPEATAPTKAEAVALCRTEFVVESLTAVP
jgi:hypothetical protein